MKLTALSCLAAAVLAPLGAHAAEYANVVSATPVLAAVGTPRRVCNDEPQYVPARPSGAGAVIGAIAGGLLGNTVGGGFGRAAATGIGAVAGAAIGNSVETNAANGYPPAVVNAQRCQSVSSNEMRTVGYDVVYEYNGQRYTTRMAQDPGPRLAIDIRPAGGTSLDRAGPPATYGAVPPRSYEAYPAAPAYVQPQAYAQPPAYLESPSAYYAPAPVYYSAPAPVYYNAAPAYYNAAPAYVGPAAYIGPAIVGVGLGYWVGRGWHRGYRGDHRWH